MAASGFHNVLSCLDNFEQLANTEEVMEAASGAVRPFGFDFILVSKPRFPDKRAEDAVLATRIRDDLVGTYFDWLKIYTERRYADADPLVRKMQNNWRPFAWFGACRETERNQRATEIQEERKRRGFGEGIIIPVFNAAGLNGFVSIGGDKPKVDKRDWPLLHLTAVYTFHRVSHLRAQKIVEKSPLTPREREVLTWVAHGKSAWEIGEILSIAKRTVDEHAQTSCQKLGAVNRAQAVAIALRDGFIQL